MKKIVLIILAIAFFSFMYGEDVKDDYMKGTIEKVEDNLIYLKNENKTMAFRIAPKWYVLANEYNFKKGDEIKLKYIELNSVKHITEIIKDDKKYKFVDSNGDFLWQRKGWMGNGERMNGHNNMELRHNGKGKAK